MIGSKMKKGNITLILIMFAFVIMLCILLAAFLLELQINSTFLSFKNDLFYICQNAILSLNLKELAYSNYVVDNTMLKQKIEYLLKLNYPNVPFYFENISYNSSKKQIELEGTIIIKPIVLENRIGEVKIHFKENIKVSLMEVIGNEM